MWFLRSGMTLEQAVVVILILLITIFVILPIHEWAHGFVAYKLGDKTAKESGRLTLNPLKHIDPLGAASMILFKFGWANPVPVNARNFKNPKLGMALTALAGPLSNLIIALFSALGMYTLVYFFGGTHDAQIENIVYIIIVFLNLFADINIGLAVFNLLPLPPLDGSKILGAFLPNNLLFKYYQYERYIMFAVLFLLFTNILDLPLNFFKNLVAHVISWLAFLPFRR